MADIEYTQGVDTQDVDGASSAAGLARAVNLLGAAASLALVVGIGVWGYKLMIRDVSGVPVVRALEGPMRVQPEDPGGRPADHQGLAVNAVAAEGTAAPPADRLVLAPRPVDLSDEDQPMQRLAAGPATSGDRLAQAPPIDDASVNALVERLIAGVKPLDQGQNSGEEAITPVAQVIEADPSEAPEELRPEPAVLTGPGLPRSLRPQVRPARAEVATDDTAQASDGGETTREVDAETLPQGTRLAQLGAFDSPEVARVEWDRLNARFEDYLDGKTRVIEEASSGGRTFYRLRAMGFADINDARRFCSVLVAENADCIPVTSR